MMPDRKLQLQKLLEREPDDPFLVYGLALEHKKAGESKEALELLDRVISLDPLYCYAYFQSGQIRAAAGDVAGAKAVLQRGVNAAVKKNDSKAQGELLGALDELGG
jgi:tetratricopeptide (TPR) repeat protein